jgi:hypothetical protein
MEVKIEAVGNMVIVAEMPFITIIDRREMQNRLSSGILSKPPELFVVCYSAMQDVTTVRPVDWDVAATLAPEAFGRFLDRLQAVRSQNVKETMAEKVAEAA